MPHVLVAGKLHPAGLAMLSAAPGITHIHIEEINEPSYAPLMLEADAVIIRTQPMSATTIAAGTRLKIVSRHGVGYDAVDVAALNARGIPLCIVGDVNSVSVAEHAMMLILACVKRLKRADDAVRHGPWTWRNRLEAGRIGRHLGRMALAFGMQVRAHDPYLQRQGWPEGPVSPVETLADGLSWADIVSVNMPKAYRPVLAATELSQLRRGAIIINTARGGIVDEVALAQALESGHVAAAGLDVFETEPPAPSHPLAAFDQVILTPHIAGLTAESAERMAVASVQNVLDFFAGRLDPALVVNKDQI